MSSRVETGAAAKPPPPPDRHRKRCLSSRAGLVALVAGLFLACGVLATWPAIEHANAKFLAGGAPGHGEAAAGDHLQTGYRLWLVGHQLEHGRAPWRDPYSFRPELGPQLNPAGWPFGLPYWPLAAALGTVLAWNAFILLTYLGAGAFAFLWLRELDLRAGAALAGGVAFALAPYRVQQSTGHLLGPVSLLIPLALWAWERGRRGSAWWHALAAASLASIPLSGQVHLALGAIPFFALYAACRSRGRGALLGGAAALILAVAAGILVDRAVIAHSLASGHRSLSEVSFYSADWQDFVTRHQRHGSESFVLLGWVLPFVALAGVMLAKRRSLAVALGLGAAVPILLALGTNLPLYSWLWHHFSPLRYPRVPERLMPIACLALAGLAAIAVERLRIPALVAVVVLAGDLHVRIYGSSAPGPGGAAYAAIDDPGRLLELPVLTPDVHLGSVYYLYDMKARRERPSGYSTLAPARADEVARSLQPLNTGDWSRDRAGRLRDLGVRFVAVHEGIYEQTHRLRPADARRAEQALTAHGWTLTRRDGAVLLYTAPRV
jgi:hypothetical protein